MNISIKDTFKRIISNFIREPVLLLLIILMGLNQLFFNYISLSIILSILIGFGILTYVNIKNSYLKESNLKRGLIGILIIIFIGLIWMFFNFSQYTFLNTAVASFIGLICFWQFLSYFYVKENFSNELKQRIVNLLVSVIFAVVIYILIYFIFSLINMIAVFDKSVSNVIFRVSNCIAAVVFFSIFISYKYNEKKEDSVFFKIMFFNILPYLLTLIAVLYSVYCIKIYYLDKDIDTTIGIYKITSIIIYLIGVLNLALISDNGSKKQKLVLNISLIFVPVIFILNSYNIMQKNMDTSLFLSLININILGFLYLSIVFILFAAYFIYILIAKNSTMGIKMKNIFIIGYVIMFFPVFGFFDSNNIAHSGVGLRVVASNKISQRYFDKFYKNVIFNIDSESKAPSYFDILYINSTMLGKDSNNTIDGIYVDKNTKEEYYKKPDSIYFNTDQTGFSNYNIENFKNIYLNVNISGSSSESSPKVTNVGDLNIYIDKKDLRYTIIKNTRINKTSRVNIYDKITEMKSRENTDDNNVISKYQPARIEFDGGVMLVSDFSFNKSISREGNNKNKVVINEDYSCIILLR